MRIYNSETVEKIMPALIKANSSIGHALKDSKNPHFKSSFASLESVLDAIKPAYLANEIVIVQTPDDMVLVTTLMHSSGQFFRSYTPILSASPNDPQKMGSGLTYARRYSLAAMAGIGQHDDDGHSAAGHKPETIKETISPAAKALGFSVPEKFEDMAHMDVSFDEIPVSTRPSIHGDYRPTFGKFKDIAIREADSYELNNYCRYLEESARKDKKPLSEGAKKLILHAEGWFASMKIGG